MLHVCLFCVCGISDQSNTRKGMSFYCVCAVSFGDAGAYRVACLPFLCVRHLRSERYTKRDVFYCVCTVSFGDTGAYYVACLVSLVCAASQIRAIHKRECPFIVCAR